MDAFSNLLNPVIIVLRLLQLKYPLTLYVVPIAEFKNTWGCHFWPFANLNSIALSVENGVPLL